MARAYYQVENLNLTAGQWNTLVGQLEALGADNSHPNPAYRNHWVKKSGVDAIIYEADWSATNWSASSMKSRLATILGVGAEAVTHAAADTEHGMATTYTETSDRIRVVALGGLSPAIADSRSNAVQFLIDGWTYTQDTGMPALTVSDYTKNVELWWNDHPLNPDSAAYRPTISSPANEVDVAVDHGNDLQAAIDALPSTGGKLLLDANHTYAAVEVVGKSNVHFIGQTGTVLRAVEVFGQAVTESYAGWLTGIVQQNAGALDAAINKPRNFYFYNLTFDGDGVDPTIVDQTAVGTALMCRGVDDVLVELCTVQNYLGTAGWGLISTNGVADGIYARDTTFDADVQNALYVDGAKGYGAIGCTFEDAVTFRMGLHFCNNDFTADYDQNGVYSYYESRYPQYGIYSGNTINRDTRRGNALVSAMGGPVLVIGNNLFGQGCTYVVELNSTCNSPPYDDTDPNMAGIRYTNYDSVIADNDIQGLVSYILKADGAHSASCGDDTPGYVGRYTVRDNHVGSLAWDWVEELAPVSGPNSITGNTVG